MELGSPLARRLGLALLVIILLIGALFAGRWAVERVVHNYLLDHPEVLPLAMANLEKRENAAKLGGIRKALEMPFAGAVLGNPKGKVTLVEFTDYACTYCRQSVADVDALIKANPELRVVIRELPILSEGSAEAARMGFAAAEQGKYAAFHHAMFMAGRADSASIDAAARMAGVDLAQARKAMADPRYEAEIERNVELARKLGFNGTPSWVVGEEIHGGAVGREVLAEAIAKVRS